MRWQFVALGIPVGLFFACSDDDTLPGGGECALADAAFEPGDPNGHPDPFGAKAAGQARAGKIQADDVAQPAHGRQRIEDGDYLLINDKIAVAIEDADFSDGYARFGGEILSVDAVGDDGKPLGISRYVETLNAIGISMIDPAAVGVVQDGSDGGEAIVRVTGDLKPIPFMQETFGALFQREYDVVVALDYVLAPGDEFVTLRWNLINRTDDRLDLGVERTDSDELIGFFQLNHNQGVTSEYGYAEPAGEVAWAGFDGGDFAFAWQPPAGEPITFGLEVSGFQLYTGAGYILEPCSESVVDRTRVIAGGPHLDGLLAAVRRADGEADWRKVEGTLTDSEGAPLPNAYVHEVDAAGNYLSRTMTNDDGSFTLHAPDETVTLIPQLRGYPTHAGTPIGSGETSVDLEMAPHGWIAVTAEDTNATALPVRVQVIPSDPEPATPAEFGVLDEVDGRLHQAFVLSGEATLPVPPGQHRVIVTRGTEFELLDTTIDVAAGETVNVDAILERSVDTTGVLCADFHIHSFMSADSPDPVDYKVAGAIADGLEIPVSSEHEWIVDFQPVVEQLGMQDWAHGMASTELTTFTWGHFGVVPLKPRPDMANQGTVDWVGRSPADVFDEVQARPENPFLIVNHPSGGNFSAYFSQAGLDPDTGTSDHELWSDNFEGVEVFNDSSLDENRDDSLADWFALLNAGRRVTAVGSSDSHKLRSSPIGYPRTCLALGYDAPSQVTDADVVAALEAGKATISGGAYMTVVGPGGEGPGDDVPGASAEFTITVEAPSFVTMDTLEVIVNGETVAEEELMVLGDGPSNRYVNQVTVSGPGWVVFHARGDGDLSPLHPGRAAFAVSNPIYLGN